MGFLSIDFYIKPLFGSRKLGIDSVKSGQDSPKRKKKEKIKISRNPQFTM